MNDPVISKLLNGKMIIYDDVFIPPELHELVMDVKNLPYLFGEVDNVDLPPTGMSTGDYLGTKIFHTLWEFVEKHCPEVHGYILKRSHANIFAPREPAFYHVDDEREDAYTFMFYANETWDINDGGETKFITNLKEEGKLEGDKDYPLIYAIPPIPGRMLMWKSNILHTATPLRDAHRFTPTFKFVAYDEDVHGKLQGAIRMGYPETYPWNEDAYIPPLPIKEIDHSVANISVFETNITNVDNTKVLEEINNTLDNRIDNNSEDTHYEDLIYPDGPACKLLTDEIERIVTDKYGEHELTGVWTHLTETNGSTTFHNHHGSDLSFVYYPNIEPKQGNLHFKVFANTDTYEKQIVPTTGMLLIFKSSIPHYTGKNVSGKNRYCISGNFKRKESV